MTLTVDPNSRLTFATIQAALNALPPQGGVIELAPLVYNENPVATTPFTMRGFGQVGPCFTAGLSSGAVIQSPTGTILTIGNATGIMDPGCVIEGVTFSNPNGGTAAVGLHAGRMRCLTLRDCVFHNFQPTGTGLFLDGTGGWNEWAHIENCCFSNCAIGADLFNTTAAIFQGGYMTSVAATSIGIQTRGVGSDTLTVSHLRLNGITTGIILNGNPINESADISVRIEAHDPVDPTKPLAGSIGILCMSGHNRFMAPRFYGLGTAIELAASATNNWTVVPVYSNCTANRVDAGTGNAEIA